MVLETSLEHRILDQITANGGYAKKNQATGTTGRGRPDISACIDGRWYSFEVKRETGHVKTTVAQIRQLADVARAGGRAFWVKTLEMTDDHQRQTLYQPVMFSYPGPIDNTLRDTLIRLLNNNDVAGIQLLTAHQFTCYYKKDASV